MSLGLFKIEDPEMIEKVLSNLLLSIKYLKKEVYPHAGEKTKIIIDSLAQLSSNL